MNRPTHEPSADARLIRVLVEITTGAFMARQVSHDTVQSILQKHGISGQLIDADGTLRTTLPPSPALKFKVGDRVEWTNLLYNTFVGTVLKVVTVDPTYEVQFDDRTRSVRSESELRATSTKPGERQL